MTKTHLFATVAAVGLMGGVLSALPAAAHTHPVVAPVSEAFKTQSGVVAARTVQVMQTGTSDLTPAPEGDIATTDLPAVDAGVVNCPKDKNDASWRQIPDDLRKIARPGECYARLLLAPKFENYMDHVVVQEAHTETRTVAEATQLVEKDVVVVPEHTAHKVVPAVTHQVVETVVVTPETWRDEPVAARYETRMEHVMIAPARQVWVESQGISTGAALVTPVDHQPVRYRADGTLTWPGKAPQDIPANADTAQYLQQGSAQTVYCLKIIPAQYRDQETQVLVTPATTRRIDVPAVMQQVTRTVVDQPEQVQDIDVPAAYEKQKVREVVTPEHTESFEVPAVYKDVVRSRVTGDAQPVWREVLCSKNASPEVIMDIQKALAAHGYQPGAIDGHLGTQTVSAMQKFEADRGLPQGQISVEAVKALGVSID